jgi:heptosyltransferase-2
MGAHEIRRGSAASEPRVFQPGELRGPRAQAAKTSRLGHFLGKYIERFDRPEPISFGAAFGNVERVLVIPERGITGALFAVPTLRAMRRGFPRGKIAALVREEDKELLEGAVEVDRVIGYSLPRGVKRLSAFMKLAKRLKSYRFDVAILLDRQSDFERIYLCYMSGATIRAGLQSDESHPFLNLEVSRRVSGSTRAQLGLEIARIMGIDVSGLGLMWEVPEQERRTAEQLIHFRKPREDELLIGFDPGPGRGGTSVSAAQQAKLLDQLCSDYNARAILLTSPDYHDHARKLEGLLSREPIFVQQRRTRDVVSLLGQCDLFVAGNTDLVYFAIALGIPTVSMMTASELEAEAYPDRDCLEIITLVPGDRFPIEEFMERTQSAMLRGAPRGSG